MKLVDTLLNTLPKAKLASGRREITCRCVYCGDSKNDPNKRSMYISVPQDDSDVMLYNCYRASCGKSGIVTEDILLEWGIYDKDSLIEISNHNTKAFKKSKNKKLKINNITYYKVYNKSITSSKRSLSKLNYINNRLGLNFTYNDILKHKIVLNLVDLLKDNNINTYTRDRKTLRTLNLDYIGFLSMDNGLVNLRNVSTNKNNMRYVNYIIFKDTMPTRFYIIPTNVDINKKAIVHIAEGVFDILSIKYNVNKDYDMNNNHIYASAFGSSYYNLIKWFILDSGLREIEFHIYPDNDVSYKIINVIKDLVTSARYTTYIHRNKFKDEKDFGVTADRIKMVTQRIY